jgi:hypothetical protein
MHEQAAHAHVVTYFVNGEQETAPAAEPSVSQVLEGAGFTPATDYTLVSENPPEDYGSDYERRIHVHPNQRFQARYKAPTPTS